MRVLDLVGGAGADGLSFIRFWMDGAMEDNPGVLASASRASRLRLCSHWDRRLVMDATAEESSRCPSRGCCRRWCTSIISPRMAIRGRKYSKKPVPEIVVGGPIVRCSRSDNGTLSKFSQVSSGRGATPEGQLMVFLENGETYRKLHNTSRGYQARY